MYYLFYARYDQVEFGDLVHCWTILLSRRYFCVLIIIAMCYITRLPAGDVAWGQCKCANFLPLLTWVHLESTKVARRCYIATEDLTMLRNVR